MLLLFNFKTFSINLVSLLFFLSFPFSFLYSFSLQTRSRQLQFYDPRQYQNPSLPLNPNQYPAFAPTSFPGQPQQPQTQWRNNPRAFTQQPFTQQAFTQQPFTQQAFTQQASTQQPGVLTSNTNGLSQTKFRTPSTPPPSLLNNKENKQKRKVQSPKPQNSNELNGERIRNNQNQPSTPTSLRPTKQPQYPPKCDINIYVKTLQFIQQQYRQSLNKLKSERRRLHPLRAWEKSDYMTIFEHADLFKSVYEFSSAYERFSDFKSELTFECPEFHQLSIQGGPYLQMWIQWIEYQHDQWSVYPGIHTLFTVQQENKAGYRALFTMFDELLMKTKKYMEKYMDFEETLKTMHEITDVAVSALNELQWKERLTPHMKAIHTFISELRCLYHGFQSLSETESFKKIDDDSLIYNLQGVIMIKVRNRLVADQYAQPELVGWDILSWTFIAPLGQSNWQYSQKFAVSEKC